MILEEKKVFFSFRVPEEKKVFFVPRSRVLSWLPRSLWWNRRAVVIGPMKVRRLQSVFLIGQNSRTSTCVWNSKKKQPGHTIWTTFSTPIGKTRRHYSKTCLRGASGSRATVCRSVCDDRECSSFTFVMHFIEYHSTKNGPPFEFSAACFLEQRNCPLRKLSINSNKSFPIPYNQGVVILTIFSVTVFIIYNFFCPSRAEVCTMNIHYKV